MAYITSWYWNKGDFRKVNEDSFTLQRVRARKKELIFAAVCDGIGGLRAGECASGLVAEQLTEWFYREGFWKMRTLFWTKQMKKRALDALLDMQEKLERCVQAASALSRPVLEKLGSAVPLQAQQIVIPMLAVGLCFELQPETVQLVADFVLSTITVEGQLSGILKTVLCHFQENYITVLEAYDPADHGMTPYTRREEL